MRHGSRFVLVGAAVVFAGSFTSVAAQDSAPGTDAAASEMAPDTVLLTGAALGAVLFAHASHEEMTECTACHHESRPELALSSPYQSCAECHTAELTAPMLTDVKDAFHAICIDCHVAEAEAGVTVPVRCTECHKRENNPPAPASRTWSFSLLDLLRLNR